MQWRACHDSSGERGIAASEYDTFAPKRAVSRKAHAGNGDEDPMPASSSVDTVSGLPVLLGLTLGDSPASTALEAARRQRNPVCNHLISR